MALSMTADPLIQGNIRAEFEREWGAVRKDTFTEMAARLEARVTFDVFGQQKSPEGVAWDSISPLTLKIRQADSRGNTRLGTGPRNTLIRSFRLGDANNVFEPGTDGYRYGSKLKYKGKSGEGLVAVGFGTTSMTPRAPDPKVAMDEAASEFKGAKVRRWMGWKAGVNAPAPGKSLVKPGRKILGAKLPAKWMSEQLEVASEAINEAAIRAVSRVIGGASELAAQERAGTAPGRLDRRISEAG